MPLADRAERANSAGLKLPPFWVLWVSATKHKMAHFEVTQYAAFAADQYGRNINLNLKLSSTRAKHATLTFDLT